MGNNYTNDWINKLESELHWQLYWQQQNLLQNNILNTDEILEIGIGTKFTSNYLKSKGLNIQTIDIDPVKNPDIVADITTLNFSKYNFDVVLAFEIFEHIPYESFLKVLKNIKNSSVKKIFFSIPRNEKKWLDIKLKMSRLGEYSFRINTIKNRITCENHLWEMDYKHYLKSKVENDIISIGYNLYNCEKKHGIFYYQINNESN